MELGLLQREIQTRFGLDKETYANWEKDRCQPAMRHWPGIIEFLGCEAKHPGRTLMAFRRHHGLSRNAMASLLEVDPHTLWRWEAGRRKPVSQVHIDAIRVLGVTMTTACTPAPARPEIFAFPCDQAVLNGKQH